MSVIRSVLAAVVLLLVVTAPTAAAGRTGAPMGAPPPAAALHAAPVSVPPVDGPVVRRFDPPTHRFAPGHRGVDLAATAGQTVRAVRAGTVVWAGAVAGTGYVTVDHGGGLTTTYGDVDALVTAGDRVAAGGPVAVVRPGRTHLDWGARWDSGGRRRYLDPLLLLRELQPVLVAPTR